MDLTALKSAVDAISGFTAAITGTATIPAAFLKMQTSTKMDASTTTLAIKAYEWEEVFKTIAAGPFAGSETNKNDADFENISGANLNGVLYLGNGYDECQKYDGQTLYRIGCPKPDRPTLDETAAGGGAAEVTDITTRAEIGVAQIQTVTTIADAKKADIRQYRFDEGNDQVPVSYNNYVQDQWMYIHTPTEHILVWWAVTNLPFSGYNDQPTQMPIAPDRFIKVDILHEVDTRTTIVSKTVTAVDADSAVGAVVGSSSHYMDITVATDGDIDTTGYHNQMPGGFLRDHYSGRFFGSSSEILYPKGRGWIGSLLVRLRHHRH